MSHHCDLDTDDSKTITVTFSDTNSCMHSYILYSLTCAHTPMCTCSHCDILFLSLSLFHKQSTIHVHFVHSNGNVSFQSFADLWQPYWLLALLLLTSKRWLILFSPIFRWSLAPCEVQNGCSKQMFKLVFVLSHNKVEENCIVKNTITENLPRLSLRPTHNCCGIYHRRWQYVL